MVSLGGFYYAKIAKETGCMWGSLKTREAAKRAASPAKTNINRNRY